MERIARRVASILLVVATVSPLGAQNASSPDDESEGRQAGHAAANTLSASWFAKGLIGGLIGGPIGTGIVFSMAGKGPVELPSTSAQRLEAHSPLYSQAFVEAYEEQRRMKRRESSFVGGMLGTVVWTWAILRTADLVGGASQEGTSPKPPEGA